jgi:tetratricopeptide (TPR) repeat protein
MATPHINSQAQANQLFAQGLQLHSEGQLEQAMLAYEQALKLAPKHFQAMHHVGIAAFQMGDPGLAEHFIRSALAINPDVAKAHTNLGNALKEQQRFEDALQSYEAALALQADDPDTYYNRGAVLQALQRHEEALDSYDRALALNGSDGQAWSNRGVVLKDLGRHEAALESVDRALALDARNVEAHCNRGNILNDRGDAESALGAYDLALELFPGYAEAWYNRGRALYSLERYEDAVQSYGKALALNPNLVQAYNNRAMALRKLNRLKDALVDCQQAIALQRDYVEAYRTQGQVLREMGRADMAALSYEAVILLDKDDAKALQQRALALNDAKEHEAALESVERAIAMEPDTADFYLTRGVIQRRARMYDAAIDSARKAVELAPHNPAGHTNIGRVLEELGRVDEAMDCYEQALAVDPACALAHFNRGLIQLQAGNYADGWQSYEWRWRAELLSVYKEKRNFEQPLWTGEQSLEGKTILLWGEQGLGDTLQFCRYASLAAQRGATVILEVKKELVGLMGTLAGVSQIVAKGEPAPAFDLHCPLMSLPLAFGTRLETIPAGAPYLASDPAKVAHWARVLGEKTRLRVGVVWSGNPKYQNDAIRSITLGQLDRLFGEDCEFVVLQKEVRAADKLVLDLSRNVRQFAAAIHDFSDTAALCELMDVIITVDTSVAHLAGALGKPVWVLLPNRPDWRWLLEREDSPWYPNTKLYRQPSAGDWNAVVGKVHEDLRALAQTASDKYITKKSREPSSTLPRTNMSIVIINWQGGENDPFTYFSACMKQALEQMGRPTHIVNLDNSTVHKLVELSKSGIDFVFLWQGIGSQIGATDTDPTTIWDQLKVPVLCYHGDHACHMPVHHKAVSPWVQHIYATASFAMFANTYVPRETSATFVPPPVWFGDGVKDRFEGDFFVFPKNIDDLDTTLDRWRGASQRLVARFFLEASDAIISEFRNGNRTSHHDIIDAMLNPEMMAALCAELQSSELAVRFHIHMHLDKIHRNAIAEHVINELEDVPLKVYGRGWDRFKLRQNRNHEYLSFDAMSDNSFQFASRYGVIDAAPIHDSLHDRTLRAMGNRAGFLMGSDWSYETFLGGDYGNLFFDGATGALRARAERVMQSPEAHREQCRDFTRHYQQQFSLYSFTKYLEGMSNTVRARARA